MRRRRVLVSLFALSLLNPAWTAAQTRAVQPAAPPAAPALQAQGRLLVTVVDPSGGVIPSATVTITGLEPATTATAIDPVTTSSQGIATLSVAQGRYDIKAEFPGFDINILKDVRVRSGDNRHVIVLPLPRLNQSVTVGVDKQVAAADRTMTLGTALTRDQIDSLSDDPDELKRQLADIAGSPDAIIRVDSFEGSALPLKSQIKAIHITRDAFAAENHNSGGLFVDIITQPGIGPIRGGMNLRYRGGALSGRSPFAATKGPEQIQNYSGNFGGSLARNRSSFSLSMSGQHSYDTPIVTASLPSSTISGNVPFTAPRDNVFINGLFDYAISPDQTLRVNYNQSSFRARNQGVGQYDLPERAFATDDNNYGVRIQEAGPLGRRFFTNTRVSINRADSDSRSTIQATTVRVLDAFTSGGQQTAGGQHSRTFNGASDLDYVRGIHSVRTGVTLDGGWYRSDSRQNYLGTYTFESLSAYDAGTPRSYTRRIGDPNIDYFYLQSGVYLQDDIRVRRNLTLSPGIRYEAMLHVSDALNFGPRFGVTWAPFKSGRTTLRGSVGLFYDWMNTGTYEQVLKVDGYRQREFNIVNPAWNPDTLDPGGDGTVAPVNKYLLGDLNLPMWKRVSAGFDQTVNSRIRFGVVYAYSQASHVFRGNNLNAPVNGVRPDPTFANIVEVTSDGHTRQHSLSTNVSLSLARPSRPGAGGPVLINGRGGDAPPPPPPPPGFGGNNSAARFDWRRLSINANYNLGHNLTNAEGPFSTPATGSIDGEWGPTGGDVRNRFNFGINSSQLRNLNANLNMNAASATPYNIKTGLDSNGDLIFNDRPSGVSRNSARGSGQWSLNANMFYTIAIGRSSVTPPPGIIITSTGGGAPTVSTVANLNAPARYRVQLNFNATNLTNHSNYGPYNGTLTSPLYGHPNNVTNPRKVDFGLGFSF